MQPDCSHRYYKSQNVNWDFLLFISFFFRGKRESISVTTLANMSQWPDGIFWWMKKNGPKNSPFNWLIRSDETCTNFAQSPQRKPICGCTIWTQLSTSTTSISEAPKTSCLLIELKPCFYLCPQALIDLIKCHIKIKNVLKRTSSNILDRSSPFRNESSCFWIITYFCKHWTYLQAFSKLFFMRPCLWV